MGDCMLHEGAPVTLTLKSAFHCHSCQLESIVVLFKECTHTGNRTLSDETENKTALVDDFRRIGREGSISIFEDKIFSDPYFVEAHQILEVLAIVSLDLHIFLPNGIHQYHLRM